MSGINSVYKACLRMGRMVCVFVLKGTYKGGKRITKP